METRATIVTDLGYGDAGKGRLVDYLARTQGARLVIRHNGGSQAAHNVVTPDGRHHTFSQFGAATFVPGVRTHLSRYMLVNPRLLLQEAQALATKGVPDALQRLTIDQDALVVTPYQQAANWVRELARGNARHGSCGHGVGETMADWLEFPDQALHAQDMLRPNAAARKLEFFRQLKLERLDELLRNLEPSPQATAAKDILGDPQLSQQVAGFWAAMARALQITTADDLPGMLADAGHTVFEAAQGVLLDEWYGFHPFTTWSTTTPQNALTLLDEAGFTGHVTRLGVLRAYATRHGAGPFVTEDAVLTREIPDQHNGTNQWQQGFRVGYFDAVATRYALSVAGRQDGLVVTNLDRLYGRRDWKIATSYNCQGNNITDLQRVYSPDLDYQQALTDKLELCTPQYETLADVFTPDTVPEYLRRIEAETGHDVVMATDGPAADATRELAPLV